MKGLRMYSRISWKRILVFMVIATVISNVFRFNIFELDLEIEGIPSWMTILTRILLGGSGVIIGALIAISFLKKERKTDMTLLGTSISKSLLMAVIPIIFLTVIGVKNKFELNIHFYGFIAIIGTLLYCIMEEYGWRGYLHEELKTLKAWQKYVIIGCLWYLWHLTFLEKGATVQNNIFALSMMIFGSWGIGQVATSTKSILASACFHLIIQIMMFNGFIRDGITISEKLLILSISIAIWFVIVKKWEKENTGTLNKE
ncbi:CPBP family glutamic-type intramembrane protease [uncultured Dokdonia sp.]|uniref:CPBP family glutamic-type intramembrane protease n=1 Tax=uncultured Dokdonia sp. TaxID=575653 RepID=UPI002632F5E3|nr:CPBP family glutamic-type intramembrane protease [uncultured Dokdonia sp.]